MSFYPARPHPARRYGMSSWLVSNLLKVEKDCDSSRDIFERTRDRLAISWVLSQADTIQILFSSNDGSRTSWMWWLLSGALAHTLCTSRWDLKNWYPASDTWWGTTLPSICQLITTAASGYLPVRRIYYIHTRTESLPMVNFARVWFGSIHRNILRLLHTSSSTLLLISMPTYSYRGTTVALISIYLSTS